MSETDNFELLKRYAATIDRNILTEINYKSETLRDILFNNFLRDSKLSLNGYEMTTLRLKFNDLIDGMFN